MKRIAFRSLAVSSLLFGLSLGRAATRPRYGGTLRVEIAARVSSLAPPASPDSVGGAPEEYVEGRALGTLRALVEDRLVRLDGAGQPQSVLAVSWEHDARSVRWRFKLRPGVNWHDGSPVTAAAVASSLEGVVAGRPWTVAGDTIEIDTGSPRPELLVVLATAPESIVARRSAGPSGAPVVGTGPFRVAEWESGRHAVLVANEDYWGGRPYLDSLRIEMGRSSRERLIDLELDKADLVELDPGEARRAEHEGRRVWASAPAEVLALVFNPASPRVQDRRVREAIARSIDRAAIQKVLLQNYGEVAAGLLPQWLSGFAFLFSTAPDLVRARQLKSDIGALTPLRLGVDASDALAREVAERVAVNARDAGILLGVAPLPSGPLPEWKRTLGRGADVAAAPDAMVLRGRIDGPTLDLALRQSSEWFGFPSLNPSAPEEIYGAAKRFLDDFTTVPLVDVPELVGLGPRVKNWSAERSGDWRLDDLWLEADQPRPAK